MQPVVRLTTRFFLVLLLVGATAGFLATGGLDSSPAAARSNHLQQAADTPIPPYHLVISEFRSRGPAGENDDYVELYNPTGEAIDIGGWLVKASNNAGGTITLVIINSGTSLSPGQHYLLANSIGYSGSVAEDQSYNGDVYDNGGVAVATGDGMSIVDQAGTHASSAYLETSPLPPLVSNVNQSYEREPGGTSGSCYDTNDNLGDFSLISPSEPQNFYSPATACSGAATATATETSTATTTATGTGTSTPTLSPPAHVVISEFRTRGPGGTVDEFVEIFNPTGATVNIGGWLLKKSSGCGTGINTLLTVTTGIILQPGQHYLMASSSSSAGSADQIFTTSITDNGGIALLTGGGGIVDQVGMCDSTQYVEGDPLDPLTGSGDQGYERKIDGCVDRDNNADDFLLLSPSEPKNRASPPSACLGAVTPTVTSTRTPTMTRTPTPSRTPTRAPTEEPGYVVINEFLPHPRSDWNGDGETNVGDEYVEIMNLGDEAINLKNWRLDDDEGGSSPYKIPELVLQPLQIIRLFGSQTGILLSDGGDTVRLLKAGGHTSDIKYYPVVEQANTTWCRLPDGSGAWGFACYPTPGRPNIRIGLQIVPQGEEEQVDAAVPCVLADTVPAAIAQAECSSSGGGIWNTAFWDVDRQVWCGDRFKWMVFVE